MPHSSMHLGKTSSCYGIVIKLQEQLMSFLTKVLKEKLISLK